MLNNTTSNETVRYKETPDICKQMSGNLYLDLHTESVLHNVVIYFLQPFHMRKDADVNCA